MIRFAHLADCHLGGWRQEELQNLNFESFRNAVDICISEKVDFILISGDLFDSAYPPIEILRDAFGEFKKIKDAKIPVYLIAGSHDFSASGKTFLDVLESAGFIIDVENFETKENEIILSPTFHGGLAIFGYSGKKSGLEIDDLKKIKFNSVYSNTIFMIHTTIKDVVGNIPMDSIKTDELPLADYYAMGHIHQVFEKKDGKNLFSYPGPIFPNNFQELADLKCGSFNIVEMNNGNTKLINMKIPIKDVVFIEMEIENGLTATEKIIDEIDSYNLKDKIVLMKLSGTLTQGKSGDIRFDEIEQFVKKKECFIFLRNISSIKTMESNMEIKTENVENLEEEIIKQYAEKNPTDFNALLNQLMNAFVIEKNEDEKASIFENRLIGELKRIFNLGEME